MQVKLLRVLQERVIRRVGDERERPVEVRVVAATNQDLQRMAGAGTFREDLFYRLNVVRIRVPPLRERHEDIPMLARAFVLKFAQKTGKHIEGIQQPALDALSRFDFPGNVRELENYMERAVALAPGPEIRADDLPEDVRAPPVPRAQDVFERGDGVVDLEGTLQRVEKQLIDEALRRAGGVKTRAAELLGLSFRSLRYRLQKLGYSAEDDDK
jgi:two-component system response regulator PilR (NtrC family)